MAILPDIPQAEAAIIAMSNAFRASEHLAPAKPNAALTKAAHAYAEYLARTGQFSHTADGRDAGARATGAGYAHCEIAENLALNLDSRGFETGELAKLMVEAWKKSPGHRHNLLLPYVTETGVALVRVPDKNPKYVSVQLFGRPQSLSYKFIIANKSKTDVAYTFSGETHDLKSGFAVTYTVCLPGQLSFAKPGGGKIGGGYEARNGTVYTLRQAAGGGLSVEVSAKRK